MAAERITQYSSGDTSPPFVRNFGAGLVDISTWTIRFNMRRADGTFFQKVITTASTADGQITDGPAGDFQFTFVAGELIEGRSQEAEIEFDKTGGDLETEGPLLFDIRKAIA